MSSRLPVPLFLMVSSLSFLACKGSPGPVLMPGPDDATLTELGDPGPDTWPAGEV